MAGTEPTNRHELRIEGLRAKVAGREILQGIDLVIRGGEVHAVMGPNGSGKSTLSHVLMGKPGYEVTAGRVLLDGTDLLALPPWRRAQAGLFLAMQYPIEVPGVSLLEALEQSFVAAGREPAEVGAAIAAEASRIGFAVLDELDSGLDVDALRACSRRIEAATHENGLGVLAITHYSRLLRELKPDVVHVMARGQILQTGGPELADELEKTGYAGYGLEEGEPVTPAVAADPFADPLA
jgi:Fe-S cluster assembly ATP-binding protein